MDKMSSIQKSESHVNLDVIRDFIFQINSKNKKQDVNIDIELVMAAIDYLKHHHKGQTRHSGEPYFYHLIEVARITADYLSDTESILAALLHDVIEDTNSSAEQIDLIFGKRVSRIVQALSKITVDYQLSKEEVFYKITNVPDIEETAVTIKVIDRLHNMRTIHHIKSAEKQKRIATETLHFYIPLAKSVGLQTIANELNTIAVRVLNQ